MTATFVRFRVLGLMCSLAMITYLDRALNGSIKKPVMESVGYEEKDYFLLLVAFQLAYALFEIPSGWLGDTKGTRKTLLRIVLFWSFFLGLMALAGLPLFGTSISIGFWSLVFIQFLFGMGEAGAFPNIAKALYHWFPATQRAFVQGTVWFSSRMMGGLTPFIWILLTVYFKLDWRITIAACAGLGIIWAILFAIYFRNKPSEDPSCNEAERTLTQAGKKLSAAAGHHNVPWKHLFSQPNLWFLCGMYFCSNFGWYFLMYFLPTYMKQSFGINSTSDVSTGYQLGVALLTGSPFFLGGIACIWGGILSDRFIRRTGNRTLGRKLFGMLGYAGCCLAYIAAIFNHSSPYMLIGCLAMVGFFSDLTLGPAWATAQDIGKRYAAIISGCMNMIGNLGAAISNYVTGLIIAKYSVSTGAFSSVLLPGINNSGSPGITPITTLTDVALSHKIMPNIVFSDGYVTCLTMYATAYGIGVIFWYLTDANKPLADD